MNKTDFEWQVDEDEYLGESPHLARKRRLYWRLSVLDETPTEPEIDLAPDWQQAIISFEQVYAVPQDVARSAVMRLWHTAVTVPIPLPEQVIRMLCFDHSQRGMRWYKHDPASGVWEVQLPGRSFSFLDTLPGGRA